jgi:hypothetical protein
VHELLPRCRNAGQPPHHLVAPPLLQGWAAAVEEGRVSSALAYGLAPPAAPMGRISRKGWGRRREEYMGGK